MRGGGFLSRRDIVIGGTLAAGGLVGARRAWSQAGPVRIGVLQTISGPLAPVGLAHVVGARIAARMLNDSGGIDGRPVELLVRDTRGNGNDIVAAMRDLAGSGVNLLVGEAFSTGTLAAVPIAPSLDVVYVASTVIAMEFTHDLFNRHCFHAGQNAYMQFLGQAKAIADHHPHLARFGCLLADAAGFRSLQRYLYYGLGRAYGAHGTAIELMEPVLVKVGANDYRDQAAKLFGQNIDGLVVADIGAEEITFVKQANAFGLFKTIRAVGDGSYSPQLGPALKRDMPDNWWTTCSWVYDAFKTVPMAQTFYKVAVAETGQSFTDPFNAQCHLSVTTLAEGVRRAKSTRTIDVIGAIETMTYDTVYGPMNFRKEDHQILIDVGYVRLGPDDGDAGWKVQEFFQVPWQDSIEEPSPGKKFELPGRMPWEDSAGQRTHITKYRLRQTP